MPDWGALFTVTQRAGASKARQLFLTAELIDAARARAIGLVDEVIADDDVQAAAVAAAGRLMRQPKRAYAYTKRLLQNMPASLEQALEFEVMAQENCFKSEDFFKGVAPFLPKDPSV